VPKFLSTITETFCAGFIFVLAVFWAAVVARDLWRIRRFYRTYRGRYIFVATRRHGWYDFIRNNVMPTLPADVEVAWVDGSERGPFAEDWAVTLRRLNVRGQKPFLLRVMDRRVVVLPLHEQLNSIREQRARSAAVQQEIREILVSAIAQAPVG
jgi:hypothetical protein